MSVSFTGTQTGAFAKVNKHTQRRVLVTGSAGRVGLRFIEQAKTHYRLRLMVQDDEQAAMVAPYGEAVQGELLDFKRMRELCIGMDAVLHLAADPSPSATWKHLLDDNIIGTYNTMVAAKLAGCRRLVFASSIHAVSGYPSDVQVKTSDPVNPGDLYGVTKCFGEALGRYMAGQEGLSVIAVRIGAVQSLESAGLEGSMAMLDAFISHDDLNQLFMRCLDVDNVQFAILHGLSNNRFKRLDISDARELVGYHPMDDLTEVNPTLKQLHLRSIVPSHNQSDPGQRSGLRQDPDLGSGPAAR